MIRGTVNSDLEAMISLVVRGPEGSEITVDVVIDTGFDGWLSLSASAIASLQLPWSDIGRAILADGSESVYNVYRADVWWNRELRPVFVDEADAPALVGTALLRGSELNVQLIAGGSVTIKTLRRRRKR